MTNCGKLFFKRVQNTVAAFHPQSVFKGWKITSSTHKFLLCMVLSLALSLSQLATTNWITDDLPIRLFTILVRYSLSRYYSTTDTPQTTIDKNLRLTPTFSELYKPALCKNISFRHKPNEQQPSASNHSIIYINKTKQLVTCGTKITLTLDVFR